MYTGVGQMESWSLPGGIFGPSGGDMPSAEGGCIPPKTPQECIQAGQVLDMSTMCCVSPLSLPVPGAPAPTTDNGGGGCPAGTTGVYPICIPTGMAPTGPTDPLPQIPALPTQPPTMPGATPPPAEAKTADTSWVLPVVIGVAAIGGIAFLATRNKRAAF